MKRSSAHVPRIAVATLLAAFLTAACAHGRTASPIATIPNHLVQAGRLTLGSDITYPPLEYFNNGSNRPQGFDIRVGDALASAMGLRPKWVDMRFWHLIPALRAGRLDAVISGVTVTPARSKQVDFLPYFSAGQAVVARRTEHLRMASADGLCGLKVAVESHTTEAAELARTVEPACRKAGDTIAVATYPTDLQAVHQVVAGQAQAEFTDSPVAYYDARRLSGLQVVSTVLRTANCGIAVRKDDPATRRAIAAALAKIRADGTLARLIARYDLAPAR